MRLSFCPWWGGGVRDGGHVWQRGHAWHWVGACMAGETATAVDGTHHIGMHFYRPQQSWGKVIFSQASVILSTGGVCSRGLSAPRGGVCVWFGGVCAWSRGVSVPRGCLVETPRDGYCCGRYASYWNAFLLNDTEKVELMVRIQSLMAYSHIPSMWPGLEQGIWEMA